MTKHKPLSGTVQIKDADRGQVQAVFSTFNVIDRDGDVTLPGAFEDGAEVVISAYGHKTWTGAMPVGEGRIRNTKSEAVLDGQFFMDTRDGQETFTVVKRLGVKQQWSYGYDTVAERPGTFDGQRVRFLERLKVHEVSPVFQAAGVNTRTLAVKALTDGGLSPEEAAEFVDHVVVPFGYKAAIRPHETPVVSRAWDAAAVVASIPADASIADLRSVFAFADSNADPEVKSSYKFPHHHGPGGPANLRACMTGIAVLNGGRGGADIPDSDRQGIYNHMAAHLEDGDRDVPELRGRGDTGSLKFHEEAAMVLASVASLTERTSEVMALRRRKGKAISASTLDILEWTYEEMRNLRAQLDSPQEDADREFARFIHLSQPLIQGVQP
jgi:hypothetical protein